MKFNKKTLNILLVAVVVAVIFVALYYLWKKPTPCYGATPCPPPTPIYKYYGGKVLPGYDIDYFPDLQGNVPALEDKCNANANCLSFSTDGHLKSSGDPALLVPCGDMYFKLTGPAPSPIPSVTTIPPPWANVTNSIDNVVRKTLNSGESIYSADKTTELKMQTDGNLVLYQNGTAVQATNTNNSTYAGGYLLFRENGSLVVHAPGGMVQTFLVFGSLGQGQYVLWLDGPNIFIESNKGVVYVPIKLNVYGGY